jgi:hypothetical protein
MSSSGRHARHSTGMQWHRLVVIAILAFAVSVGSLQAQNTWEFSPYRIRVWVAFEPAPELTRWLQNQILGRIENEAVLYAGVTWKLNVEEAPRAFASTMVVALDELTIDQVSAVEPEALSADKIMLINVGEKAGDYYVACREFDCRTRTLGHVVRFGTPQRTRLPRETVRVMAAAFSPLVRIERSQGKNVSARVRAGGLVLHDHCVSLIQKGDILRPIIRRNDRRGDPKPGGIEEVAWTYLVVREQEDYLLECDVYSAMRNPLAGRNSTTIERMALKVNPRGTTTRLRLMSQGTSSQPLEGYEVFSRRPLTGNPEADVTPERLGRTDWQGEIDVPQNDSPLRLIYVKNGDFVLARLPVVPGLQARQSVELPSDDKRLEAEAFVEGMEYSVMDVVARRQILAARIRRRLDEGKIDQAKALLEEIKTLPTRDDFFQILSNRQQAGLSSSNKREQIRIDQLLSGTRILLNKYLDPDDIVTAQREIDQASKDGTSAPAGAAEQPAKSE